MNHTRVLRFESLEARQLLSSVRHAQHAVAGPALVLSGTLKVENNGSTTSMDDEGDTSTSTPVVGQLGSLGEVHGVWTESSDQFGDYIGPDTVQIHAAKGTFVIAFSEQHTSGRTHLAGGAVTYSAPQIASQGTGAYAGVKESGSIQMTTNKAHTSVATMTLSS